MTYLFQYLYLHNLLTQSKTFEKEDVAPETKIDEKKDEPPVSKDVKDRLADLKNEFKKTKKRSAELGVRDKKR